MGVPVLTGPNNFNSPDAARLLIGCGAAQVVAGADELAQRLGELLGDPAERARMGAAGRACLEANRGALAKVLSLIEPLLTGTAG